MPTRCAAATTLLDADFLRQIDGDGVDRMGQRVGQGQRAVVAAAEIAAACSR